MSDLVAEARRVATRCKAVVDAGAAGDLPYALLDDLADEIERLRGLVTKIKKLAVDGVFEQTMTLTACEDIVALIEDAEGLTPKGSK